MENTLIMDKIVDKVIDKVIQESISPKMLELVYDALILEHQSDKSIKNIIEESLIKSFIDEKKMDIDMKISKVCIFTSSIEIAKHELESIINKYDKYIKLFNDDSRKYVLDLFKEKFKRIIEIYGDDLRDVNYFLNNELIHNSLFIELVEEKRFFGKKLKYKINSIKAYNWLETIK